VSAGEAEITLWEMYNEKPTPMNNGFFFAFPLIQVLMKNGKVYTYTNFGKVQKIFYTFS
jgi:hexokinase